MGELRQAMKAGLGSWITWGMYSLGATETALATIAAAKRYESLDLWLAAGLLDLAGLYYNYKIGISRLEKKHEEKNKIKKYQI